MNIDCSAIDLKVQEVLKDNLVEVPPVRVDKIVINNNLKLAELDFSDEPVIASLVGALSFDNVLGLPVLLLNKNQTAEEKVFTIARGLGHFLLHKDYYTSKSLKNLGMERIPLGKAIEDKEDAEAIYFASRLLIPEKALKDSKDQDLNTLAKIFGVSTELMAYRMK